MSWVHFRDTTPVARKDYRCHLCGVVIPSGIKHLARHGVNDGRPNTTRMHLDCELLTHDWLEDDWECFDQSEFLYDKTAQLSREQERTQPITPSAPTRAEGETEPGRDEC